jgi:hypothetical protein
MCGILPEPLKLLCKKDFVRVLGSELEYECNFVKGEYYELYNDYMDGYMFCYGKNNISIILTDNTDSKNNYIWDYFYTKKEERVKKINSVLDE